MSKEKYEDKIKKIEENMELLEKGDLDIEEMVRIYAETMKIAEEANQVLENAEAQINKLMDVKKDE